MTAPRPLGALAAALVVLGAAACESTQSKSAKLEAKGGKSFQEEGLRVKRLSKHVKVMERAVLSDENGQAAVAQLKNTSKRVLYDVPVAIDVRGKGGKSLFKNDDPGIEPSLAGVSVMKPGESVWWTNDQVFATGKPTSVQVRPGQESDDPPRELPEIEVKPAKLVEDPTSGVAAEGKVINRSKVLQRKLVIFGVAVKDGRVVAAGRSQAEKLRPGKDFTYQIFFIGDPRGARIELAAPPTTFE